MELLKELRDALFERLAVIITMTMDTVFLIAWLYLQVWFDSFADQLVQSGSIDLVMLAIFQSVFALATLSAVLYFIAKDIVIIWRKFRAFLKVDSENQVTTESENRSVQVRTTTNDRYRQHSRLSLGQNERPTTTPNQETDTNTRAVQRNRNR